MPANVHPGDLRYSALVERFTKHLREAFLTEAAKSDGFSMSWKGIKHEPESGYAVAFRPLKDEDFAAIVIRRAAKLPFYAGWWRDAEDGKEYSDLVMIFQDRAEAVAFARLHEQKAIYSFKDKECIKVTK